MAFKKNDTQGKPKKKDLKRVQRMNIDSTEYVFMCRAPGAGMAVGDLAPIGKPPRMWA